MKLTEASLKNPAAARSGRPAARCAALLRKEGSFVVRVDEDGGSERVPVETGSAQGDLVEVSGDVRAGDSLIVRGGERLLPGQRVVVAEAAEAVAVLR